MRFRFAFYRSRLLLAGLFKRSLSRRQAAARPALPIRTEKVRLSGYRKVPRHPTIPVHKSQLLGVRMIVESEGDRQFRVDQTLATLRLEGEEPSPEIQQLMSDYVRGILTLTAFQDKAMAVAKAEAARARSAKSAD